MSTPPSPPSHVPALDPSTVASRDFDFDVDLIGLDSMQLVALRHLVLGRIGFCRSVPKGLVPLKPHHPVVSWADPLSRALGDSP